MPGFAWLPPRGGAGSSLGRKGRKRGRRRRRKRKETVASGRTTAVASREE
jgi:hypothetical protein